MSHEFDDEEAPRGAPFLSALRNELLAAEPDPMARLLIDYLIETARTEPAPGGS